MAKRKKTDIEQNLQNITSRFKTEIIENGADAVVVILSMTQNNRSRTMLHRWGNTLLCDAILRHTYHTEAIVYVSDQEEDEDEAEDVPE